MSMAWIKRRLVVGTPIELVHHGWFLTIPLPLQGVRTIKAVRSSEVRFSNGSWLCWPPSKYVRETALGFEISLADPGEPVDWSQVLRYEWR